MVAGGIEAVPVGKCIHAVLNINVHIIYVYFVLFFITAILMGNIFNPKRKIQKAFIGWTEHH